RGRRILRIRLHLFHGDGMDWSGLRQSPLERQSVMSFARLTCLTAASCSIAIAIVAAAAYGPVAMIPVDGEAANYWTRWRGPSGQGLATGTGYVDSWSDSVNVKWRADVPGRGHSSPIVWKDAIFLTTARDNGAKVSMLAYRRGDGRLLWEASAPSTGVEHVYYKNSHASATPTTDGHRVYASFGTHGLA